MQRKDFLLSSLLSVPAIALAGNTSSKKKSAKEPFIVDAGKSRFGEFVKFLGGHPNGLKISSKDADGELSAFDYTGFAKAGPMLYVLFSATNISFSNFYFSNNICTI